MLLMHVAFYLEYIFSINVMPCAVNEQTIDTAFGAKPRLSKILV